ncbi:phosphatase, partial [Streptomyces violaceoruber]
MDSTPSPSSSSPFDLVSSALGRYIPRGGAAAAGPAEARDDSGGHRPEHDRPPVGRQEQILGAVNLDRELRVTHRNLEAPVFAGL